MNNKKHQRSTILMFIFLFIVFLITPSWLLATEKKRVAVLPFVMYGDELKHGSLESALKSVFISHLAGEGIDVMDEQESASSLSEKDRKTR